jgi:hypothetical protein
MKKSYFQAIVMLMVFSVFGNATVFAKTSPPKNNALFATSTRNVFSNPLRGTKTVGAVANNSYWQKQRAKGYVDFTHFYAFLVTAPPTADATLVYAGTATLASLTVTGKVIKQHHSFNTKVIAKGTLLFLL